MDYLKYDCATLCHEYANNPIEGSQIEFSTNFKRSSRISRLSWFSITRKSFECFSRNQCQARNSYDYQEIVVGSLTIPRKFLKHLLELRNSSRYLVQAAQDYENAANYFCKSLLRSWNRLLVFAFKRRIFRKATWRIHKQDLIRALLAVSSVDYAKESVKNTGGKNKIVRKSNGTSCDKSERVAEAHNEI